MTLSQRAGYIDPAVVDFLNNDVQKLLQVAAAAIGWDRARNAESLRQAADVLHARVRDL